MTMTDTAKPQRLGFWPGFSTGVFVPLVVALAIGVSGLEQPWFGIATLVELATAILVVAVVPRWRTYAAGALAGLAVFPVLGLVLITVTHLFFAPPTGM